MQQAELTLTVFDDAETELSVTAITIEGPEGPRGPAGKPGEPGKDGDGASDPGDLTLIFDNKLIG